MFHDGRYENKRFPTMFIIVVGGVPVAVEFARVLAPFNGDADLIHRAERILIRDFPESVADAPVIRDGLYRDVLGLTVVRGGKVAAFSIGSEEFPLAEDDAKNLTALLPDAVAKGIVQYVGPEEVRPGANHPVTAEEDVRASATAIADGIYEDKDGAVVVRGGKVVEVTRRNGEPWILSPLEQVFFTNLLPSALASRKVWGPVTKPKLPVISQATIDEVRAVSEQQAQQQADDSRPTTRLPDGLYTSLLADQSVTVKGGRMCGHTTHGQTNIALTQQEADAMTASILHSLSVGHAKHEFIAPQDTACSCVAA